jgi:hypothetical protein
MVETERDAMIEIPSLKWPEIERVMYWYTGELDDLEIDSLLALFVDNRAASSIDVDSEHCYGELMIRYDPESGDVAGIEIEGFERFFLGEYHPELAAEWAALKPEGAGGFHNSAWLTDAVAIKYARVLRDLAQSGKINTCRFPDVIYPLSH